LQLLGEVGFVSVRAEDRTELFVRMLKKEVKRLTDSQDEFIKVGLTFSAVNFLKINFYFYLRILAEHSRVHNPAPVFTHRRLFRAE